MIKHCFRCGFNSKRECVWMQHLGSCCTIKYLNLTKEEIIREYDDYLECYMELIYEDGYTYRCIDCDFITKHEKSYNRHINNAICKKNTRGENARLKSKLRELEKEKEIEQLKRKLVELESKINTNNTVPTTVNIENQTVFNGDVNITNNYGSEELSFLTLEKWGEILVCLPEAIPKLVEEIHYNRPENRNITIPNMRGDTAKILKNGVWTYTELCQILEHLFTTKHDAIEDFLTANKDQISPSLYNDIDKMLIMTGKEKNKKIQKKKIKNVIINNRHLVTE